MNSVQIDPSGIGPPKEIGRNGEIHLTQVPRDLENRVLRQAVRENVVSFPSQVPVFERQSRPDLQHRIVVLYFVRGWSMEDIAKRCGLGRQRMGQILTAWRMRAVKEGYLQPIEPDHPLLQRVKPEQAHQFVEAPVDLSGVLERASKTIPAPIAAALSAEAGAKEPQAAKSSFTELRGRNVSEELETIVGILDNQLRLCSKPMNGNMDSCEQLLTRAKVLCERLEARDKAADIDEQGRITVVISSAKELFRRFQEHTVMRRADQSKPAFGQRDKGRQVGRMSAVNNGRNMPPRMSQRVAVHV